jgi:hypothetical protein
MRCTAPAPIPGAKISVCHAVGGMFRRQRHDHHVERAAFELRRRSSRRLASLAFEPKIR